MSILDAYKEMTGEDLTGRPKKNPRDAALPDAPAQGAQESNILTAFEDMQRERAALRQRPVAQEPVAAAPEDSARPAAIPTATETQRDVNPFVDTGRRMVRVASDAGTALASRGAEMIGSGIEGLSRVAEKLGDEVDIAVPALRDSRTRNLTDQEIRDTNQLQYLNNWANSLRGWGRELGYQSTTQMGELTDNPMNLLPFITERIISSAPDMAAAVVNLPGYVLTRTNEILNERMVNDGKTLDQVTVGDVAAATGAAIVESTLERFATKGLGKTLEGGSAVARVGKQTALQSTTEGIEEGAAYLGATAGTEKGVDARELGANMLEGAIVGGGLGAAVETGKEVYESRPETKIRRALDAGLNAADTVLPDMARRDAVRALDPNSYDPAIIDPAETVRTSDAQNQTASVQQPSTAVPVSANPPEQPPENSQAQQVSQPASATVAPAPQVIDPARAVMDSSEDALIRDLEAQEAAQDAPAPEVPPTFVAAVESIKADLGVDAADALNLTEVTSDTRLNRFKNALESAFGVNVHWVDFGEQLTTASGKQLGAFSGYRKDNTILVSTKDVDFLDTTWHELTHVLETRYPDVYKALRDTVVPAMDPTVREQLVQSLNQRRQQEVGRNMTAAELDSELVAYVVGDQVRNPQLLGQMFDSFGDPAVAKNFRDILTDILNKLLAVVKGPQYIRERARLIEAQKSITTAFAEFQKRETQKRMAAPAQPAAQAAAQPAAVQQPAPKNPAPAPVNAPTAAAAPAALPKDLAGAKPRYAIGNNQFDLNFESDLDKAAFITSQSNKSKRDGDYRAWLRSQGLNDVEIAKRGQAVRAKIKSQATGKTGGELTIDRVRTDVAAPAPAAAAPVAQPQTVTPAPAPAQAAPAAPRTAVAQAQPAAMPTDIEADESASYKRTSGQFSRDVKLTGEFAGKMFLDALENSPQEMVDQYLLQFGREINADLARELSPIYQTNPAVFSAFVHDGASRLSKMVFDRLLETAGPNDVVRFTAGGGGSGKGYALNKLSLQGDNVIIFDGTMSKLATATSLIDKSLAAGVKTEVWYVNADAMWALNNALKRASTKGRTVPIEVLADAHTGAADVARILVEQYASTAPFRVVNNTVNGVTYGTIADIPRYNAADLKEKMYAELDRRVREEGYPVSLAIGFAPGKYSAGTVTERAAERDDGAVREPVRRGARSAPETVREQPEQPARQAEQAEPVTPFVAPETIPGDTKTQPAESNRFRLNVRRAERQAGDVAELSADELSAIAKTGEKLGVSSELLDKLTQQAIETKRRFPTSQGWAPLFLRGVMVPKNKTPAEAELNWEAIPYKFNVPDGIGNAPAKLNEQWADQVSDEFYKLIKQIYGRAMAGDRNANIILSHKNWYRNVTEVLRREFGAMGDLLSDLLGATSPNTPVDTNWRFSIDIMRRFVRGDFNAEMKAFTNYVTDGGKVGDYPATDKIKQLSGKLYGMNSTNAMLALADTWRQIHPGQAPKARNFALNLIGQSDMATIDVWAARMLRRAASALVGDGVLARIPTVAEQGVTGKWNVKATAVGGEFGFGARVMETVAQRLRDEGIDVTAPDLQAIAWFAEKELWAKNGWTSAQGEGGSFEENIDAMPMERYLAGWSVQQGEAVPEETASSMAQSRVMYALRRDSSVIAARVMPTKGLYGGTVEQSFDTEWTVERGKHDPSLVLAEISQIAKENNQYDIFVSKVLLPEEDSANARPGVEIYFRDQRALDAAVPVLERFTSKGVDGFTMAVDPRAEDGNYIGVRLQYIPEISMRWDEQFRVDALQEGFIEQTLQNKLQQLNDITAEISQMDGVAFAKTYQYDTIVVGKENYDAYIDRATAGGDRQTRSEVWFGQPVRDAVERAAARLNRDSGQVDGGGLQDASRPAPESVGQFSRQLVELAANQDRRAPALFGISETPTVLRAVGGPRQLLVMEPRNVAKVVNPQLIGRVTEEGGVRRNAAGFLVPAAPRIALTVDELRAVPQMLADPVAIIRQEKTASRREGYKFLIDLQKSGYPVVAVLHDNVRYGDDRATELVSIYPANEANTLDTINRELNSAQLVYYNKGKATVLASKIGNKLPSLAKVTPTLAKSPSSVPSRTLPPIRSGGNFSRRVPTQGQRFTLPERTARELTSNALRNRMSRVAAVQRAVVEQGGTTDLRDAQGNVVGDTDITRATEAMSNAAAARLESFRDSTVLPLVNDAAELGVNLDEVAQYLYALYAPERNAIIQQRNPTQFATDGGSGMTNAEAIAVVGRFRARRDFPQIEQIAQRFKGITRMTQNVLLSEGLVDPVTIAQWRADNPNYVPLRGFEEVDENTGEPLKGGDNPGRLDPRNPFVKTAKGRESRAGDILENIFKDYEDAVVLAEKNLVYRRLLKFVQDNPDPKLWEVDATVQRRTYRKGALTLTGQTQGQVSVSYDIEKSPANTIAVRVKGRPVFIKINDPGMLDDLQMNMFSIDNEQGQKVFEAWQAANNVLKKTYTSLNPVFVLKELARSSEQVLLWNATKYGAKSGVGRAFKKLLKSAKTAYKAERDNNWAGNNDTITIRQPGQQPRTISVKEAYEMFKADGGKTAFLDIRNVEDIREEIARRFELARAASSGDPRTYHKRVANALLSAEEAIIEFVSVTDNAFRFATYMARLEAGNTRQEAADAARNVTVNHAAKGKMTPLFGAAYMFFNPAVQGAENTFRAAFRTGWRGRVAVGSMIALGLMIAEMQSQIIGDDDEPYWDKDLYKQAKLRNIPIFNEDGDMAMIPLLYGWGFFVNLGYAMNDMARGVPVSKVGAFIRDSFFTHFSPLGSMENPATFFSPTMLDPVMVISGNKTDQGVPLMPDSEWNKGQPDSEKFWGSTRGTMFQQTARWLNEVSGGNPYESGSIDISPETMRYMFGFLTGGTGGFVRDASESIYLSTEIGTGAAFEKNKIPILKSFFVQNTGKADQVQFYRNADEATEALRKMNDLYGTDYELQPKVAQRLAERQFLAELGNAVGSYKDALSALRQDEIDIIERRTKGELTAQLAEEELKLIAERKNELYVDFNREFYQLSPDTPE